MSKRELAFVTAHHWVFDRKIPDTDDACRALALYREARNAQQNFLVSYAVLNYYKILEIGYPEGPQTRAWIAKVYPKIARTANRRATTERFDLERGQVTPEKYIYKACRLAVAHASLASPSDPDNSAEISRLHMAADVLKLLARHFIAVELGVPETPWEPTSEADSV